MVRKKSKQTKSKFKKGFGTFKGPSLPSVKKLTREQVSSKLISRREMTLKKIIESPTASQSSKERARKLLGI